MHFVFRTVSRATLRRSFLSPLVPPANSLSIGKQLCIRLSSTGRKSKSEFSSLNPLPTPPPPPKGRPLIINTHDIEQYVQPLYARGWELSGIGNSIAVLRKRFEFADAEALEGFLADLSEYEEKKKVRSLPFQPFHLSCPFWTGLSVLLICSYLEPIFSIMQRQMCLMVKTQFSSAHGRMSLEGRMGKWRIRARRHRG